MLNSFNGWKPTVLVDLSGQQQTLVCFEANDQLTSAWLSCSISWRNQLHVFGGAISENKARQISRLDGTKLANIGSLLFDHQLGACSTIGETIYLCFNSMAEWNYYTSKEMLAKKEFQKCRRASSPTGTYAEISLSKEHHMFTRTTSSDSKLD